MCVCVCVCVSYQKVLKVFMPCKWILQECKLQIYHYHFAMWLKCTDINLRFMPW